MDLYVAWTSRLVFARDPITHFRVARLRDVWCGSMITTRGVEEVANSRTVRFSNRLVRIIGPIFRLVVKLLPGARSYLAGTLGGRSGELNRLMEKKRFPEAFKCALDGVTYCETHRSPFDMQRMYWWIFMENAARSAKELGDTEQQQVVARLGTAPAPGGLYEAHCLEMLSRWRWRARDEEGAIDFARRTVLADATWPAGHILLAWYGLITGKFDPLPKLREAVRVSPTVLEEIRTNADFARFPDLIAALGRDRG